MLTASSDRCKGQGLTNEEFKIDVEKDALVYFREGIFLMSVFQLEKKIKWYDNHGERWA